MSVTIRVFDPAMCCSTSVCGPSVDADLARFAADLDWLKKVEIAQAASSGCCGPSAKSKSTCC